MEGKSIKIGILTWFIGYNIGAVLQAKALQYIIAKLKIQNLYVETIYYQTEEQEIMYRIDRQFERCLSKNIKKMCVNFFMFPIYRLRKNKIDTFIKSNMNVSHKYIGNDIRKSNSEYDIFLCGSDQIWNPEWLDTTYLLDFVNTDEGKVCISYAASIGLTDIPHCLKEQYKSALLRYRGISVRELSGVKLLEDLTGRTDIVDVCDPTLLLTKEEWNKVLEIEKEKIPLKHYILCYFLGDDQKLREQAKRFQKNKKMKIVNLSFANHFCKSDCGFGDIRIKVLSPQKFVALIAKADYVLTDSFHGTAFSIIEQREFFVFGRLIGTAKGSAGLNDRIDNLLDILDIRDRYFNEQMKTEKSIDYLTVQEKLGEYRKRSLEWIKNMIVKKVYVCGGGQM